MRNRPSRLRLRLSALAIVSTALAAAPSPARAEVFTFLGTYNSLWDFQTMPGYYGNWLNGLFPTWSALYDDEIHLGSSTATGRLVSNVNIASARLGKLVFDQAGGVDLTGNALRFGGGGTIAVMGAAAHTMANDIVLNDNAAATNTLTVDVVTDTSLAASGTWSGNGALVKTGTGTLTLSGANTYTGGTTVQGGTVRTGSSGALANGDLTLLGGDLDLNGSSPTVRNLTFGDGATSGHLGTVSGSGTLNVTGAVAYKPVNNNSDSAIVGANLVLSAGQHEFSSTGYGNAYYDEVLSGEISGEGGIDKTGSAYLLLNHANTYAGATNLDGGVTFLGVAGALPATTALSVAAGAHLHLGFDSQPVGSLAGAGYVNLESATLTVGGLNTDTEFSGIINGLYGGSLVKTGTGTLTLSGTNLLGATTIQGGAVRAGSDFALGGAFGYPAGDLTLTGGDLDLNGFSPTVRNLTLGDGATGGNLGTVEGAGTLKLTGEVAFHPVNYGSNPAVLSADLALSQGQHAFSSTAYGNDAYYDEVFSGTISGAGGIDKTGPAFLVLNAPNAYAGTTNVLDGGVFAMADGALPASTALTVDARGGLYNSGLYLSSTGTESGVVAGSYSQTIGSLAGKGNVFLGSATLTVGTLNSDTAFSGMIADADIPETNAYGGFVGDTGGRLVKIGTGTLTLSGKNSYTGGTTVNGGRLVVSQPNGTYTTNATLEFASPADLAYSAPISGTGAFVKSGAGTLTLSDANTYTGGTVVSGGRLIDPNPHGDYVTNAVLEFANTGDYAYAGAVSGTGALIKDGAGMLSLTGSVASTVSVGISGGTLKVSANGFQGDVASTGGTLQFDGTKAGTYGGTFSGTGSLLKTGSRTLTLANAPANSGGVHLAGGTLDIDGAGAFDGGLTADGRTTLLNSSDGTLTVGGRSDVQGVVDTTEGSTTAFTGLVSGAGNFAGFGTVEFDGGYSPGNSPAAVTVQGDLVLGGSNDLTMELGGTALGTGYDHLTVFGNASLDGVLDVVDYGGFSPALGQSFDLFDFSNESGMFSAVNLPALANGLRWDASALYTTGVVRVQSVPEPAALLPLGLGALAFLRRRRK